MLPIRRSYILFRLFRHTRPVPVPGRIVSSYAFALAVFVMFCGIIPSASALPARANAAQAHNAWQASIAEHKAIPDRLIAVDKSAQRLYLLERRSPLAPSGQFICSTGKREGDKAVEGDLKTPEGIYFVVQHIKNGLNYIKYGNEAYTLNYPNPADKLRRKTGYGIWLHGRGEPIVPMQTEGCVAMINEDLTRLGTVLEPGMPVALANSFSILSGVVSNEDTAEATALEKRVREWADAWTSRSENFFDFYDPKAYALAQGESFSRFKSQKKRLFRMLPWIKNTLSDVHVLEGPGYWVTWFYQDYSAPNLSSSGVRRLYWHKDGTGEFKILGMEWIPGLTTGTLLASAEPAVPPLESSPRTEEQDHRATSALLVSSASANGSATLPLPDHIEDPHQGIMPEPALAPLLLALNQNDGKKAKDIMAQATPPKQPAVAVAPPAVRKPTNKASVSATTPNVPDSPKAPRPLTAATAPPADEIPEKQPQLITALNNAFSSKNDASTTSNSRTHGKTTEESGEAALVADNIWPVRISPQEQARSEAAPASDTESGAAEQVTEPGSAKQAAETAPEQPAKSGAVKQTAEQAPTTTDKQSPEKKSGQTPEPAPAGVADTRQTSSQTADTAKTEEVPSAAQAQQTPDTADKEPEAGTVETAPAQTSDTLQAASGEKGNNALDLVPVVSEVTERIESWRQHWEEGDLDAYTQYYAPNATQGKRKGAKAIRKHKRRLWQSNSPVTVTLTKPHFTLDGNIATAQMIQEYSSSNGASDIGIKTLTFQKIDGEWLITQEDWKAQPNEHHSTD